MSLLNCRMEISPCQKSINAVEVLPLARLRWHRAVFVAAERYRLTPVERWLESEKLWNMVEEFAERERDRRYWLPLRAELEKLRHAR